MINLKIFKILFDMTRIGWIIVGILVYFLLGWILKDIVFSIITIEGDTTMGDILKYERFRRKMSPVCTEALSCK